MKHFHGELESALIKWKRKQSLNTLEVVSYATKNKIAWNENWNLRSLVKKRKTQRRVPV